jgi:hypothetical protein
MRRLLWKLQDLVDAALGSLTSAQRWYLAEFLFQHGYNICITEAYFWSEDPRSGSFFDIKKQVRPKGCFWVERDR